MRFVQAKPPGGEIISSSWYFVFDSRKREGERERESWLSSG